MAFPTVATPRVPLPNRRGKARIMLYELSATVVEASEHAAAAEAAA
jgi:hypothetical protein